MEVLVTQTQTPYEVDHETKLVVSQLLEKEFGPSYGDIETNWSTRAERFINTLKDEGVILSRSEGMNSG